jgi:hypothetical protein
VSRIAQECGDNGWIVDDSRCTRRRRRPSVDAVPHALIMAFREPASYRWRFADLRVALARARPADLVATAAFDARFDFRSDVEPVFAASDEALLAAFIFARAAFAPVVFDDSRDERLTSCPFRPKAPVNFGGLDFFDAPSSWRCNEPIMRPRDSAERMISDSSVPERGRRAGSVFPCLAIPSSSSRGPKQGPRGN